MKLRHWVVIWKGSYLITSVMPRETVCTPMTEDVDLQPGRIRSTPREPLYKRRESPGWKPLEDDGLFPPAEPYEPADAIDDTSVDIFICSIALKELVSLGKRVPFYGKVMVEENEFLAPGRSTPDRRSERDQAGPARHPRAADDHRRIA